MPLFIPNGSSQVSFIHDIPGASDPGVVTIGMRYTGADFVGDANTVGFLYRDNVLVHLTNNVVLQRVSWAAQAGTTHEQTLIAAGGHNAESEPPNCAFLVRKNTAFPGRKNRGRWFLPGVDHTLCDSAGQLTVGIRQQLDTGLAAFLAGCLSVNMEPVIFHNVLALPAPAGNDPTPIVSMLTQPLIGSQRRRIR